MNKTAAGVTMLLMCLLAPTAADARNPSSVKLEDTLRVLKTRQDPTPADFATVGSGVDAVLVDLMGNLKVDAEIRCRAARALGFYPGQPTRAVLMNAVFSNDVEVSVRSAAMLGLARAFRDEVVEDLKAFLNGGSPQLRCGAAAALGEVGGDRIRVFLMDAIEHEPILEVRVAMEKALKRMTP